jgi:hypothetical protein
MISTDRLSRPFGALFGIELRTVGLALRREGVVAVGALASVCLLAVATALRYDERLDALPEILLGTLPIALILPWLAWKGDPAFGRAFLWTLPVRRQEAAAAKVAAGALWLMLAVLLALVSVVAIAAATGGSVGIEEIRLVGSPAGGLAAARPVHWATPLWMWFVPFGAALTLYLSSSAALLGLRHPLRALAGVSVAATLLGVVSLNLGPHNPLQHGLDRFLQAVWGGTYGLDFAMSGGSAALVEDVHRADFGSDALWTGLPDMARWATALLVWLGAALLALALALRRHWER